MIGTLLGARGLERNDVFRRRMGPEAAETALQSSSTASWERSAMSVRSSASGVTSMAEIHGRRSKG